MDFGSWVQCVVVVVWWVMVGHSGFAFSLGHGGNGRQLWVFLWVFFFFLFPWWWSWWIFFFRWLVIVMVVVVVGGVGLF